MRSSMTVTAGILIRRHFRAICLLYQVEFTEFKGWLDSEFVVVGEEHTLKTIIKEMEDFSA